MTPTLYTLSHTPCELSDAKSRLTSAKQSIIPAVFSVLILVFTATTVKSQNILSDTVSWSCAQAINQADQSSFSFGCTFVTLGNNSLSWIQGDHKHTSNYDVTSSSGTWVDISKDGQVSYTVAASGGVSGSVTFSSVGSHYTVHLKLFVNGNIDQDYIFSISSFSQNH